MHRTFDHHQGWPLRNSQETGNGYVKQVGHHERRKQDKKHVLLISADKAGPVSDCPGNQIMISLEIFANVVEILTQTGSQRNYEYRGFEILTEVERCLHTVSSLSSAF